jgi:hypothetical protein
LNAELASAANAMRTIAPLRSLSHTAAYKEAMAQFGEYQRISQLFPRAASSTAPCC